MTYKIKQGDLEDPIRVTLKENGDPTDLTGKAVWFALARADYTKTPMFRRVGVVEGDPSSIRFQGERRPFPTTIT
jgi:hypothetical protein